MSTPGEADDVKLISSIFSSGKQLIDRLIIELENIYGPTDWISPLLLFDRTRYYAKEMGWPLHRRFISFRNLIRPESIVDVKRNTNELEREYLQDGKRLVNIDPGYVCLERLILVTGKNYTHRIYLSGGIYADLTLVYKGGRFRPLEWTYRDYADPPVIDFFNQVRENYKKQLRRSE